MESLTFSLIEIVLSAALGIFLIIQLVYYFCLYNKVHTLNKATSNEQIGYATEFPPLSVVICARNESENLRQFLPGILEQDYPQFEVIVINDGSTDESEDLLVELEEKYHHLYHTFTPESARYISRKKLALTVGIKASKYDWLVFTDADCRPASKDWLKLMARNFTPRTEIVLGYSGYERTKGWLNFKASFDNLFSSIRYLGFAVIDKPYMGIGRNMAYRKDLFFKSRGFSAHLNLQRGDDDLFINEVATNINTRVETDPNAIVRMQPLDRYKTWKEEKLSYLATSQYFQGSQRHLLGFETTSRLFFHMLIIALLVISIIQFHWLAMGVTLLAWIIRYIIQAVIINKTATELGERHYYFSLPIFDILLPLDRLKFSMYRVFRGKGDFMRR